MTDELTRFRADLPPADPAAMMKARAALLRAATGGHRTRGRWQVGITSVAVAALAAAVFALPSGGTKTPPASGNGLVHNADGTITIELREVTDVYSLNMKLYEAGVRALIINSFGDGVMECWSKYPDTPTPENPPEAPDDVVAPRQNPWGDALTFWPDRIPDDMWLYIQHMVQSPGNKEVQFRCDPNRQWELNEHWVGDTTPGIPGLPPYEGKLPPYTPPPSGEGPLPPDENRGPEVSLESPMPTR